MSGYALTPLAKADIFDIWVYLAENSKSVADRVKQAIYYACAMSRRTALARSYPPRPHSPSTPILDASPLSQLHSCLPARNGPASNRCRPPRETRYSSHPGATALSLRDDLHEHPCFSSSLQGAKRSRVHSVSTLISRGRGSPRTKFLRIPPSRMKWSAPSINSNFLSAAPDCSYSVRTSDKNIS
jgi:hypothetical protein